MSKRYQVIVIGAGIGGLAAAHRIATTHPSRRLLVIDAAERLGGKIATEHFDGFVIESGPDCFLTRKPAAVNLCRSLGIEELQGIAVDHRRSYVKRDRTLHELPAGLTGMVPSRFGSLLTTRTLSLAGRARAVLEAVVPRRADDGEETVAEFATRRFGREAYEWLIEPLMAGIHAGDGTRLSLAATFPQLVEHERTKGSLLRATAVSASPNPAGSAFLAPTAGMGAVVDALVAAMPKVDFARGTRANTVTRSEAGFAVRLETGRIFEAASVIVATPAAVAGELLAALDPGLRDELSQIEHVSTAVVTMAFLAQQLQHAPLGSGYVCPRANGGPVVACSWTSNKFTHRAPPGSVLLRVFIGRAGLEDVVTAPDGELAALALDEVTQVLGVRGAPTLVRVARWPRGLPQYTRGHVDRIARIESALSDHPGLALCGASYKGVGIPDCIESGWAAADQIGRFIREG